MPYLDRMNDPVFVTVVAAIVDEGVEVERERMTFDAAIHGAKLKGTGA